MWSKDLPDEITGLNEYQLWMHIDAVPILKQRAKQKHVGVNAKSRIVRTSRCKDMEKFFYYCLKYNPQVKIFAFCDVEDKHSHIIIPWIVWIRAIPSNLKKYFEWGDEFEYDEVKQSEFDEWWKELSNFPKHTRN